MCWRRCRTASKANVMSLLPAASFFALLTSVYRYFRFCMSAREYACLGSTDSYHSGPCFMVRELTVFLLARVSYLWLNGFEDCSPNELTRSSMQHLSLPPFWLDQSWSLTLRSTAPAGPPTRRSHPHHLRRLRLVLGQRLLLILPPNPNSHAHAHASSLTSSPHKDQTREW